MTIALARRDVAAETALVPLRAMARQRPVLADGLDTALTRHANASPAALEAWAAAILALANVNAGPDALLSAFRLAAALPLGDAKALMRAADGTEAAADICRRAGAVAVRATLAARFDLGRRLPEDDETAWWRTFVALAGEEPSAVAVAARTSGRVIAACGVIGFEAFIGAGLRAATSSRARLAFLALEDSAARRVLDRLSGEVTFADLRTQLRAFATALWGADIALQEAQTRADRPRRATTTPGVVHVPDMLPGVSRDVAPGLYRAIVAHASAHLALGAPRREPGTLKPLQIVLTGLIEDARIEALAMRRFPGLRRLWAPFHRIEPSHLKTAPVILARLSRGLFDLDHPDDDAIVAKARALFLAELDLADADLSRRIGSILGNDIGQMRIQFDAKGHVIEPAYRDDNFGLWSLPPRPPDVDLQALELPVEAARIERKPDDRGEREQGDVEPEAGRVRPIVPDDDGIVVGRYPEWDRAAQVERPDWTTISEIEPPRGDASVLEAALAADEGLRRRVERLVRAARVGLPTRSKRQPDGLDLDLDAAIEAARALRAGETPDERVYQRKVVRARDLATLLLIDASESTRDSVPGLGTRVIDTEKVAVAMLAQALDATRDNFALRAFASNGRAKVRWSRLKDFSESFDFNAMSRLAGLEPGYSTRLGAALRHAGTELGAIAATRKIVIVLSDGAPSDIDVADSLDLIEDARRAVLGLRAAGIEAFGLTLDPSGQGDGAAIFGPARHMPVRRITVLPSKLSALFFRLARR